MAGTFEHTSHLMFLINEARKKQRSLTITLLDLKNAFGEVHHNLIDCTLEYHHVPLEIRNIIQNMYTQFFTVVATESF